MTETTRRSPHYRPIEDYGIIGNLSSVALVRLDGSIDWCCLPHLDSPAVFAALLDAEKGGYFLLRPPTFKKSSQHYIEATNVLVTVFETASGRLEVCDFMPTGDSIERTCEGPDHVEIYRKIQCTHGEVDVDILWAPRHDYARGETLIEKTSHGFVALGGTHPFAISGLDGGRIVDVGDGPAVKARISLRSGDERFLLNRWNDVDPELDPRRAAFELRQTIDAWRTWASKTETGLERPWAGAWGKEVRRSELVLKLMTEPSGALAAAPTTSLPETIGGVRNWDYRFTWIRDAAQIAQAFSAVNHKDEARAFIHWAEHMACQAEDTAHEGLQILYALHPDTQTSESILDHLEGYRQSGPVRIGNDAFEQLQLDVFGELLNAVYEKIRLHDDFKPDMGSFLRQVADEACKAWHHPDFGIWELQNGPVHQVYSKVMTWVALDRASWLHRKGHLDGDLQHWQETKAEIRRHVLDYGYDDEIQSFVRRFHHKELDAANLLISLMGFLPHQDRRIQNTIDRTFDELVVNDLVFRYSADDGLAGDEGAFVLCTFWLVDALSLSHRLDEANRVFENLMNRRNHLGLFSEQIDPYSGEFLGNFPQAYSHLGVINSCLYLAAREGRELPVPSLLGTDDDE